MGGKLADTYLNSLAIKPREWLELDSLEAIALMVEAGLGVAVVPDLHTSFYDKVRVGRLPLKGAPFRDIGLPWPRNTPAGKLIRLILDAVRG
ncbi:MAG: LysR substrate-binding domain-containing protein [Phyllobacterium sp.]